MSKSVLDFLAWGIARATPARIPTGSALCVPISQVGSAGAWEYLYATTGVRCTQTRLDRAYDKYYKNWGWSRREFDSVTAGWVARGAMVSDCQGLEDCFSQADTNAKGNYANYCTDKGLIAEIKRAYVCGEAIFVGSTPASIDHIGWVCGFASDLEPLILHERGLAHGCVIERMSSCGKKWTYRGLMTKRYAYPTTNTIVTPVVPAPIAPVKKATVLSVTSPMMKGGTVKDLQDVMNALGYDCGPADGVFGNDTARGVRAFVAAHKDI